MMNMRAADLPATCALWNATNDLGLGVGPLLFGLMLTHLGPSGALMLSVLALAVAWSPARALRAGTRALPELAMTA